MNNLNMFDAYNRDTYDDSFRRSQEELMLLEQKNKLFNSSQQKVNSIWDIIDSEIKDLSIDQKERLMSNKDYMNNHNLLSSILDAEFIKFMKPYVENNPEGRRLLEEQLKLVRDLKPKVLAESNEELKQFREFQEAYKLNPKMTLEDFINNKNK